MESQNPPTYMEVMDIQALSPPNVISDPEEKFCNNCGAARVGGNFCAFCGRLLTRTGALTPLHPSNKVPPITTQPSSSILEAKKVPPIPTAPQAAPPQKDKAHKFDMANKIGNRLIYDFEKVACCPGQVVGLHPDVADSLPYELEEALITKEQWREWMTSLMENQKRAPSVTGCMFMFCVPGLFAQSLLCAMFCPISMDHFLKCLPCFYGDWYVGLRKWQDEVNSVLNQRNMHVKLITYKPWQKAPLSRLHGNRVAGKDHNYEMSMMVIALTEAESEKLKMESWDHGVHDGCTSGIGRVL